MKPLNARNFTTLVIAVSDAGTNLKVERGTRPALYFFVPSTFLALQVQLVILTSAIVMVSTVWSVSCSLFYLRFPVICKSGWGARPPCPMESVPLAAGFSKKNRLELHNVLPFTLRRSHCAALGAESHTSVDTVSTTSAA